jgi:hypothetical protein
MEHQLDHVRYALLKQVHIFTALLTSLSKLSQYAGKKIIFLSQAAMC